MQVSHYKTITGQPTAEFKDRGSRFIAYAFAIDNVQVFKDRRNDLKKEHPKAVHHCFAYRLGTDGNNYRVSDDGEPSGTAGRPILGQIDSKQLTDMAIIVVRYFGGTLLGVPGLINAYKTSAQLVLETAVIIEKPVLEYYRLQFDYTQMNDVMRYLKQFECVVVKQEMQLFCLMEVGVPIEKRDAIIIRLKEIGGMTVEKILLV